MGKHISSVSYYQRPLTVSTFRGLCSKLKWRYDFQYGNYFGVNINQHHWKRIRVIFQPLQADKQTWVSIEPCPLDEWTFTVMCTTVQSFLDKLTKVEKMHMHCYNHKPSKA